MYFVFFFFFSSRRRHTRFKCDWSSDVCSSDLKRDCVAHSHRLLQVGRFVPTQREKRACKGGVGGVDVTEHLGFSSISQSLVSRNLQLRSQLFSLIAVEKAQGDAQARAKRLVVKWIVERWVVRPPCADCGIG